MLLNNSHHRPEVVVLDTTAAELTEYLPHLVVEVVVVWDSFHRRQEAEVTDNLAGMLMVY